MGTSGGSMDENERKWHEAMKAKGHMPKMTSDGDLDGFVCDWGNHNGPGCLVCGWSCCWHCCDYDTNEIPDCDVIDGSVNVGALLAPSRDGT